MKQLGISLSSFFGGSTDEASTTPLEDDENLELNQEEAVLAKILSKRRGVEGVESAEVLWGLDAMVRRQARTR